MQACFAKVISLHACLLLMGLGARGQSGLSENDWQFFTNYDQTLITQSSSGEFQTNIAIPGTIIITDYVGPASTDVWIPTTITGRPVTWVFGFKTDPLLVNLTVQDGVLGIAQSALEVGGWNGLQTVTIAGSVTNIGAYNFFGVGNSPGNRVGFYFTGNAPDIDPTAFSHILNGTVYYLPGTTGWGPTLGGLPTAVWAPKIQVYYPKGHPVERFPLVTFEVTWASGKAVVVEACTNLFDPVWSAVATNLNSGYSYFSDPQWTNQPERFYCVRSL